MLDLLFALGQVVCLFGLVGGVLLCVENRDVARTLSDDPRTIDAAVGPARAHYRPYLFDSWSSLEPSAPWNLLARLKLTREI